MYYSDHQEMSWDSEILQDDNSLIREGDYNALAVNVERGRHNGSERMLPCDKAIVTLRLATEEGPRDFETVLFLHKKTEWVLSSFFRAIGLKKHGEKLKMDWSKVKGSKLRVHMGIRTYKGRDGEEHTANNIDRYYDFDPSFFPADPQWLQEAMAIDGTEPLDEVF